MNVIKHQIEELGLTNRCSFCFDGMAAEQIAVEMIRTSLEQNLTADSSNAIQPIALMLLDFQMPRKNGLDVIISLQKILSKINTASKVEIVPPRFVFLTSYSTQTFRKHAKALGVECILEKPIQKEELYAIINGRLD